MDIFYKTEDKRKLLKQPSTPNGTSYKKIVDQNLYIKDVESQNYKNSSFSRNKKRRNSQTLKRQIQLIPKHNRS